MEKRLSLTELKAKSINVLTNSEIFTGGECEYCHEGCGKPPSPPNIIESRDGTAVYGPGGRKN